MLGYMKCIKTGCDVNCDGITFHGDLMYCKGTLVLSGCSDGAYFQGYDFIVENMYEISGCGNRKVFLLMGKIEQIDQRFFDQLKEYENEDVIKFFEKCSDLTNEKIFKKMKNNNKMENFSNRICFRCGKIINGPQDFKNEISIKEYQLSGICQKCQDQLLSKEMIF